MRSHFLSFIDIDKLYLNIRIGCEDRRVEADDVCDARDQDRHSGLGQSLTESVLHTSLPVCPVPRVENHEGII